jgi:putative transposase
MIDMGRLSSAVYSLNYHVVWCPKYRLDILTGDVKDFLHDQILTIAETKGYDVLALEIMPDHVHLFISATPTESPTEIVKIFKGITGLRLFKKFPELRERLWRNRLWSPSYYIATHGVANIETIQKYIESQFSELHPPDKSSGLSSDE